MPETVKINHDKIYPHFTNDVIFVYAFRYALGRTSYAPSTFVDFVKANKHLLNKRDVALMIKEITECEERDGLGMECDVALWTNFRSWLNGIILETS